MSQIGGLGGRVRAAQTSLADRKIRAEELMRRIHTLQKPINLDTISFLVDS